MCTLPSPKSEGSALGPLLWNIIHDKVHKLPMSAETNIIGFTNDVAVGIVAK